MTTLVEHEIHHTHDAGSESSIAAMVVAIVALAVIVGMALFFFQLFPFNAAGTTDNGGSINIDAELPAPTPTPNDGGTSY